MDSYIFYKFVHNSPYDNELLQKINNTVFSTSAAGLYLLVFAIAIGVATFIENDFGPARRSFDISCYLV